MAERKFLSSAETLGQRARPETGSTGQGPFSGNPAAQFGSSAAAALSSPLFRYGNRILAALAGSGGSMEISRLLSELQDGLKDGFNLSAALGVIGELQAAGALIYDGKTCSLTEQGKAMVG